MKKFECSTLGKELKAQTDIAEKQYQKLDDRDMFDETINEKSALKNYGKSDLICDTNHSFLKFYRDNKKIDSLSFKPKC